MGVLIQTVWLSVPGAEVKVMVPSGAIITCKVSIALGQPVLGGDAGLFGLIGQRLFADGGVIGKDPDAVFRDVIAVEL